jgi:hypothetical protein
LCSLSFPTQLPAALYQGLNTLAYYYYTHQTHHTSHYVFLRPVTVVTDLCILVHWDLLRHRFTPNKDWCVRVVLYRKRNESIFVRGLGIGGG